MKKENIIKAVLSLIGCLTLCTMVTHATENTYKKNVLIETTTETKLYEQPDTDSKELMTIEAHTQLFTQADQEGDWILVKKDGTDGYLQVSAITLFQADGISQEFEKKENGFDMFYRELTYYTKEKQQKIIWGITIGALVVAIFAVGIVSTVLKNKKTITKKKKLKKAKGKSHEADYTDTML